MLDEEDPIEVGYYLEVSSPGVFRTLFTDEHLSKYISSNIAIKLKQLFLGHRKLLGTLVDFDKENIFIKSGEEEITIPRKIIDAITLEGDL
jgi:ribosome maturation factor RimP